MSPNTHTESIKTLQLPNDQLIPELLKMIRDGHTVTLPLRGNSMRPFLEDGRDKALLKGPGFVDIGDPVLAEVAPGRYVLHRIVGNTGPHYEIIVLRGDGKGCRLLPQGQQQARQHQWTEVAHLLLVVDAAAAPAALPAFHPLPTHTSKIQEKDTIKL